MKKLLSVLLATVMLATIALTGCGKKDDSTTDGSGSGNKGLKICLLLTGNLGDMSFLDSANEGIKQIKEKFSAETKVIEMGLDSTKYETNLLDASEAGYDIVIGSGWQMQEPIENVATQFPKVKYILFDGEVDYKKADYKNVYSITYRANEGSFLAGAMAAKMSQSGKLGFLGGADGAGINDFAIGYIEGAKYVNKDIKVSVGYVGSFGDAAKCKEMALAQYNQGIDFIFSAAGGSGLGTLDAAKDKGKYAIGVDSDQAMIYKDSDSTKANLIPASVMKRVDVSLVRAIELETQGKLTWGKAESLGLADNAVGLCDNEFYTKNVPQDVRDYVADVSKKIIAGDIKVTSAYGLDTSKVTDIINSVK